MAHTASARKRWFPPWKTPMYVVLRNVSDHNILLHLPTGNQRIEKGRRLLVTPEIAHLPEVQTYVQRGWLVIEKDRRK